MSSQFKDLKLQYFPYWFIKVDNKVIILRHIRVTLYILPFYKLATILAIQQIY